jgi:hypothetical protein
MLAIFSIKQHIGRRWDDADRALSRSLPTAPRVKTIRLMRKSKAQLPLRRERNYTPRSQRSFFKAEQDAKAKLSEAVVLGGNYCPAFGDAQRQRPKDAKGSLNLKFCELSNEQQQLLPTAYGLEDPTGSEQCVPESLTWEGKGTFMAVTNPSARGSII